MEIGTYTRVDESVEGTDKIAVSDNVTYTLPITFLMLLQWRETSNN